MKNLTALDKAKPNTEKVKGFQYGRGQADDDSSYPGAVQAQCS